MASYSDEAHLTFDLNQDGAGVFPTDPALCDGGFMTSADGETKQTAPMSKPAPNGMSEIWDRGQRCPNCSRYFVYKTNFAKHMTLGCTKDGGWTPRKLPAKLRASQQSSSATVDPQATCGFCGIQFTNQAYYYRHQLAHLLVAKLVDSVQLSFRGSNTSAAMEWFTSSVAINFNEPQWTVSAVQETEILLSQSTVGQLQLLREDPDLCPYAEYVTNSTETYRNPSKSILETQLLRPIMSRIISSNAQLNSNNHTFAVPHSSSSNSLDVLLDTALAGSSQADNSHNNSVGDNCNQDNNVADNAAKTSSASAAQCNQLFNGFRHKATINLSPAPLLFNQSNPSQYRNSYLCAECGMTFPTAAAVFSHMSKDHPLSGTLSQTVPFGQAQFTQSVPFAPAVPQETKSEKCGVTGPLPPCWSLLKKRRLNGSGQLNQGPPHPQYGGEYEISQGLEAMQNVLSQAAGSTCTLSLVPDEYPTTDSLTIDS